MLTTPDFYSAYKVIPLIVLSYILYGMVSILIAGVHITKKTKYGAIFTVIAALVNTGFNFLLVPTLGMMGAAISTIISYIVLNGGIFYYSQKLYPIKHEFGRMILLLITGASIYFIGFLTLFAGNFIVIVILKGLLFLSFPALLYIFGFYKDFEKKKIYEFYMKSLKPVISKFLPNNKI